jgi:hypothetical protein
MAPRGRDTQTGRHGEGGGAPRLQREQSDDPPSRRVGQEVQIDPVGVHTCMIVIGASPTVHWRSLPGG